MVLKNSKVESREAKRSVNNGDGKGSSRCVGACEEFATKFTTEAKVGFLAPSRKQL
jgi:hypothetical protein